MDVKKFYDDMYSENSGTKAGTSFLYRVLSRFLTRRIDIAGKFAPGGDTFLDIGCGNGELLFMVRDRYRDVYGLDIVESRIRSIREILGPDSNIHLKLGDANGILDYEDGFFDTVATIAILEHVFDPYQFIRECHRVLKKGGLLIIQVPNIAWLPHRLRLLAGKLPETSAEIGWDGGHLHYFTRTSLKTLLREHGFKITRITCSGIFAGVRRVWGSLLGGDIIIAGEKE